MSREIAIKGLQRILDTSEVFLTRAGHMGDLKYAIEELEKGVPTADNLRQYFLIHKQTEISLTRDEACVIDGLEPRPMTLEEVIDHIKKEGAK